LVVSMAMQMIIFGNGAIIPLCLSLPTYPTDLYEEDVGLCFLNHSASNPLRWQSLDNHERQPSPVASELRFTTNKKYYLTTNALVYFQPLHTLFQ
jgi:hypothetical protein